MPYENLKNGQRVKAGGKPGFITEHADKVKVKHDDGTFGFYDRREVTPLNEESSLKGAVLMEPPATARDPLAQPRRDTDRGVAEDQELLGRT